VSKTAEEIFLDFLFKGRQSPVVAFTRR